jgi:hypothetical protein
VIDKILPDQSGRISGTSTKPNRWLAHPDSPPQMVIVVNDSRAQIWGRSRTRPADEKHR